ncbi:MAG TPA: AAA family ATPase [Polyangiaceae bacterium]|jgi:DNA-binding winged helix-turn-helix (wHTH) protein|nr:AAA family ATPase [Polyangiaceae bacterium]
MTLRFDDFEFDVGGLELRRGGAAAKVDAIVLRLLAVLIADAGKLVTKEQLIARVWDARSVSENVITVAVTRLRKVLGHQKGKREFVVSVHGRGYRFVRPVSGTTADVDGAPMLRGLPFVGRARIVERLHAAVAGAALGNGGVCALIGEAGIGKTSLAELLEESTEEPVFAWGHCREAGDTPPLWPFVELTRTLVDDARVDIVAPRIAAAAAALTGMASVSAVAHRSFDAVVRFFTVVAEQVPCVLVLDDLHRADAASLELLRYFVDEIGRTRVLVVATLRKGVTPEAPASGHLAYLLGHRNTTRLAVERLSEAEVAAYTTALFGDETLGRAVFERSAGNPFFMVECTRLLRDGERDLATATLPDVALHLLGARVAAMPSAARMLASIAAVVGDEFDLPLLQDVAGVTTEELMKSVDDAVTSNVFVRVGDSQTAFRFDHDLLRTVLHDTLDDASQRRWHVRVADALERRRLSGVAVPASELAHHCRRALPDGDPRRAVAYCREAAAEAAAQRAYGDAVRYTRHAREALELVPSPSTRLRFTLSLQHALYARTCASPDFEPTVHEILRVAREHNAPQVFARAALMLDLHPGLPPHEGGRAALEEARAALVRSRPASTEPRATRREGRAMLLAPEDDVLPAVVARLVTSVPYAYDARLGAECLSEAMALAAGAPSLLANSTVLSVALHLASGPADRERAHALSRELDALCESEPLALSVSPVLVALNLAITSAQEGARAPMSAALDRAARRCRALGHHELAWHTERFRLLAQLETGDTARVAPELRRHHRQGESERLHSAWLFVAYDELVVLTSSTSSADDDLAVLDTNPDDAPNLWALKVRALTCAGRRDEAYRALGRVAPEALRGLPSDREWLGTLGALVHAAVALDAPAYLDVLEALLVPYPDHFAVNVGFFCEGSVRTLLGLIAATRRDDRAVTLLEAGAAASDRAGFTAAAIRARQALRAPR